VCCLKHVEQLRNNGVINSTTRFHLVGSFYEIYITIYGSTNIRSLNHFDPSTAHTYDKQQYEHVARILVNTLSYKGADWGDPKGRSLSRSRQGIVVSRRQNPPLPTHRPESTAPTWFLTVWVRRTTRVVYLLSQPQHTRWFRGKEDVSKHMFLISDWLYFSLLQPLTFCNNYSITPCV